MKHVISCIAILLTGLFASAQSARDLTFGTDSTFEVMTWNLQGFPKNGQVTADYVKQIIETLDVDLVAIQEVDDVIAFEQMVAGMDSFTGYVEHGSYALAYIYKKGKVVINNIYEIYSAGIYSRPFPRTPLLLDMSFEGERVILINNHLKCCGDGILDRSDSNDEETRRYDACVLLKDYIDSYLADQNVFVLGDMNDELPDEPANNVFQSILDDGDNYRFADMAVATGPSSGWSYPTWPSHLDHILITNDLFDEAGSPASSVQTIKAEEFVPGGWYAYENNVTDHRPVAMKLSMNLNLGLHDHTGAAFTFSNFPNPVSSETRFTFSGPVEAATISIVNVFGQTVFTANLPAGTTSAAWNPVNLPPGLYLARLLSRGACVVSLTIVLN